MRYEETKDRNINITLKGVICNYDGTSFTLSLKEWANFKEMHPVRTKEAFLCNLSRLAREKEINGSAVKKMIDEEYYVHSHINEIAEAARKAYKEQKGEIDE